jgi:hypothetical protein
LFFMSDWSTLATHFKQTIFFGNDIPAKSSLDWYFFINPSWGHEARFALIFFLNELFRLHWDLSYNETICIELVSFSYSGFRSWSRVCFWSSFKTNYSDLIEISVLMRFEGWSYLMIWLLKTGVRWEKTWVRLIESG